MKLQALAATLLAATALAGGSAVAQATMQPVPNPPEKAMSMGHGHMMKHHMMKHHMKSSMMKDGMSKDSTDKMSAPPATPQ